MSTGTLPKLSTGGEFMRSITGRIAFGVLVLCLASASAFAQGRGRGVGQGRRVDVFNNGRGRNSDFDNRGRNQNWKCGVFVNCHDARDGRVDGRGPRISRINRNNIFTSRGVRVGDRRRYNMNDYWRRRHVTSVNNGCDNVQGGRRFTLRFLCVSAPLRETTSVHAKTP